MSGQVLPFSSVGSHGVAKYTGLDVIIPCAKIGRKENTYSEASAQTNLASMLVTKVPTNDILSARFIELQYVHVMDICKTPYPLMYYSIAQQHGLEI